MHLVEESPSDDVADVAADPEKPDADTSNPFGAFQLTDDGAWLMPYEMLIEPARIGSPRRCTGHGTGEAHLDKLIALGANYRGRRLYLLYNPATGRTNGTTPNFFATMTIRPPGIVDRPHRHVFGRHQLLLLRQGRSVVAGRTYHWEAGDLMLSAPGWAIHHHASGPDGAMSTN